MSKTHELAWAAGFFDGEGYITIQRRTGRWRDRTYPGHYLRVGVNHVAPEPLVEMQRLFGGSLRRDDKNIVGNRKPRHLWSVTTKSAESALKQMMPYLKNKNHVAAVALDFQATMVANKDRRIGLKANVYESREAYKAEIQRLNAQD